MLQRHPRLTEFDHGRRCSTAAADRIPAGMRWVCYFLAHSLVMTQDLSNQLVRARMKIDRCETPP